MAEKMTRRSFMKGAAAVAAAVSLSGVLAGCGGEEALASVTLPNFNVQLKSVKVVGGKVYNTENESLEAEAVFDLTYTGSGFTGDKFANVFGAKIGEKTLTLQNSGTAIAADIPFGRTQTCTVKFKTEAEGVDELYQNGTPLILTVQLQGTTAKFAYDVAKNVKGEVAANDED